MRLQTAATTARVTSTSGMQGFNQSQSIHDGSSQQIANNHYTPSNHPLLKDRHSIYNINNPQLGALESFVPQQHNYKKYEGLDHFTKKSPTNISVPGARPQTLGALKSNPRYFKTKGLMQDASSYALDSTLHGPGSQHLIGNKTLIMRDLLNMNLAEQHQKSHIKTASPFSKPKQTYYMDEHSFQYDPKTQAEGNYKQHVEQKLTVKHVNKQIQKQKKAKKLQNYKSKHQLVWENEQDLESIHHMVTLNSSRAINSPPSIGFPLSNSQYTQGPFSHRGTTAGISLKGGKNQKMAILDAPQDLLDVSWSGVQNGPTQPQQPLGINRQSDSMDLRNLESSSSYIPGTAPAGNGRQASKTQRSTAVQNQNNRLYSQQTGQNVLIDDSGAPTPGQLLEDSMNLAIDKNNSDLFGGRNLYSQDQSIHASYQNKGSTMNNGDVSFSQHVPSHQISGIEPGNGDSSLCAQFRTINTSRRDSPRKMNSLSLSLEASSHVQPLPTVRTTREKNNYRNKQHQIYRDTARVAAYGCHVPEYLEGDAPGKEILKAFYLKNNMEQLRVIKKQKDLDPKTYTNDKAYIFYAPSDPPLDRQIIESGARVFDYNVPHLQKRLLSHEDQSKSVIPNLDMTQRNLKDALTSRQNIRKIISFDKMTLNTSSKFGFSLSEFQELANQSEISKPLKKGRDAFKEPLKHDDQIQSLKKLDRKREINNTYSLASNSNERLQQSHLKGLANDESQALTKYLRTQNSGQSLKAISKIQQSSTIQHTNNVSIMENSINPSVTDMYESIDSIGGISISMKSKFRKKKQTYTNKLKKLENCSQERAESISKSLSKLQKLRIQNHISDEAKQRDEFMGTKSNFDKAYSFSGGQGKKAKDALKQLIKKSMKSKHSNTSSVIDRNLNSLSPQEFLKDLTKQAISKNYLENKAMFKLVQRRDQIKQINTKSPAGIAAYGSQKPTVNNISHNAKIVNTSIQPTYNIVSHQESPKSFVYQPPVRSTQTNQSSVVIQ